jgi:hypothetical protein
VTEFNETAVKYAIATPEKTKSGFRRVPDTSFDSREAAESGDLVRVGRIAFEIRAAWQHYIKQIVAAARGEAPGDAP